MNSRPTVLLAEDEPIDQLLARRAVRDANLGFDLQIVSDGPEVIAYLSRSGKFADATQYPMPALIYLDVKMPRQTGMEVLEWIRKDPACKLLPVIFLSSSELPTDVNRAYELGVTAYVAKPMGLAKLTELFRTTSSAFLPK